MILKGINPGRNALKMTREGALSVTAIHASGLRQDFFVDIPSNSCPEFRKCWRCYLAIIPTFRYLT